MTGYLLGRSLRELLIILFWVVVAWVESDMGFPGGSVVKNSPVSEGDMGSVPGLGRSLEKEMVSHPRSLAWEIPWRGAWKATIYDITEESDMTYLLNSNPETKSVLPYQCQ